VFPERPLDPGKAMQTGPVTTQVRSPFFASPRATFGVT
jgi:hypothetical protein